jgi:hypothetical protein
MGITAEFQITRGPDRGQKFKLSDELVQIGRDTESQIALTDPAVAEHQASIAQRNGRYAIYTPIEKTLEVDGNSLPAEQWVWLPAKAIIQISPSTSIQFRYELESAKKKPDGDSPPPHSSRKNRKGKTRKSKRKSASGKGAKVAQFITDQTGDQLVRLGEDGQLPELSLSESNRKAKAGKKQKQQNPTILYVALGVSFLISLSMMFFESGSDGSSASQLTKTRKEIEKFYGDEAGNLKPYQRSLRKARRAYSIRDRKAELRAYQRVLDQLNAEDVVNSLNGLTGDKKEDEKLRQMIGVLIDRK